jgi:DNA-binding CsgD family transcriptional regulator
MAGVEFLNNFDKNLRNAEYRDCNEALIGLKAAFGDAARHLGFKYFTYHILHSSSFGEGKSRLPLIISNYPDEWVQHYFRCRYLDDDPVVSSFTEISDPFLWSDLRRPENLSRRQRLLLDDARDAGIANGITFPIIQGSEVAAVSLVPDETVAGSADRMCREQFLLRLMAHRYHLGARRALLEKALMGDSSRRSSLLTARERQVLEWMAKGKTNWEISSILNISEKSIEFHCENARRKLQVHNRTHAVAKAIMLGLLAD